MAGAQGAAEKQGYLGNLEKKSQTELKDLLSRQEKLLDNKPFISRLPDKGKRIQELAQRLRSILALNAEVDGTAEMFEKMAIDADYKHRSRASVKATDAVDEESDMLKDIVNTDSVEKVIEDNRPVSPTETKHRTFTNSYENVIRQVENRQTEHGEEISRKFKTNRTVKSQHIYDVPQEKLQELKQQSQSENPVTVDQNAKKPMEITERLQSSDGQSKANKAKNVNMFKHKKMSDDKSRRSTSKLKYRYDESLEMDTSMGPLHHNAAKLLTIEDSVKVLEQQQKLHKELQAQQAAERLAQRLHLRIGDFNPEGAAATSTVYREPAEASDSEHSETELDYPD